MAVLYVDEYGATVRGSNHQIVIEKDGMELASVRVQELENLIIQQNCSVTSSAISMLLRQGVDTAFISSGGEYLGRLQPAYTGNILLRRQQYKAADDAGFCLRTAKCIVLGKLLNMRTILQRYARSKNLQAAGIDRIKAITLQINDASSMDELLGLEGAGSREYFAVFGEAIEAPFCFNARSRRPPKDPVNAMLGFAYALLENYVEIAVYACGLDPFCGVYHQERYGRESLVLDIMEELRPVIADSVVINCCNRRIVDAAADFEERDGGIFLNESGRQKFFRAFHLRMEENVKYEQSGASIPYRQICLYQAKQLAKCIAGTVPEYKPFLIK